jgi:hypothetical protein
VSDILDLRGIQGAFGFRRPRWPWERRRRRPAQAPQTQKQQLRGSELTHYQRALALIVRAGPYEAAIKRNGLPCGKDGLEMLHELSKIYGALQAEAQNLRGPHANAINGKLRLLYNELIKPLSVRLFGCCAARTPGA